MNGKLGKSDVPTQNDYDLYYYCHHGMLFLCIQMCAMRFWIELNFYSEFWEFYWTDVSWIIMKCFLWKNHLLLTQFRHFCNYFMTMMLSFASPEQSTDDNQQLTLFFSRTVEICKLNWSKNNLRLFVLSLSRSLSPGSSLTEAESSIV